MTSGLPRKSRLGGCPASDTAPAAMLSPAESARYTLDLLDDLRKIAQRQGQGMLAHLLELAQAEARILLREAPPMTPDEVSNQVPNQTQDTRLPG